MKTFSSIPDSFFASDKPIPRQVTMQDGSEHTIHFKELPAFELDRWRAAQHAEDRETRIDATAKLLVLSVCEPGGSAALTVNQVKALKPAPLTQLLKSVLEVNDLLASSEE